MTASVKRILIAGAVDGLLGRAAAILARAGFDAVAIDDEEGFELFVSGPPPDLLIVEENFGTKGGVDFCWSLRSNLAWRGTSLMLAVAEGQQNLQEALPPGINDVLVGPFPEDELVEKARRLTAVSARSEVQSVVRILGAAGSPETVTGTVLNVSRSGLLIEADLSHLVGRRVDLEFFLPDDPAPIRCSADVVRRVPSQTEGLEAFGVQFVALSEENGRRLARFVRRRSGTFFLPSWGLE